MKRFIFFCALILTTHSFAEIEEYCGIPTLKVSREGVMNYPADQFTLRMSVTADGKTGEEALISNNKTMTKVHESLTKMGLTKKEMKTERFQIQPIHSSRPKSPPRNWKSEVIGYKVTNALSVTSTRIKEVGEIIGAATLAEATRIESLIFSLEKPEQYRKAAIEKAFNTARQDALDLSDISGIKIGKPLNIAIGNIAFTPIHARTERFAFKAVASVAPQIEAGDIPVKATITIIYEMISE